MSRNHSSLSLNLLYTINSRPGLTFHELQQTLISKGNKKAIYDSLFRLKRSEYLTNTVKGYFLTKKGADFIHKELPEKDGVWKVIIFDIPETKRKIRNFIRSRLQSLGFKKWQNSIWISPYKLQPEIEQELNHLAKKFFIRLIKTNSINYTKDLDKLFDE